MLKYFMCLVLALLFLNGYTQRSTLNKNDRDYLVKHLNDSFAWIFKQVDSSCVNKFDVNRVFLLTDELPVCMLFKISKKAALKALSEDISQFVGVMYCEFLREFPQFKRVRFQLGEAVKVYSLEGGKYCYYNDVSKKKMSLTIKCQGYEK